MQPLFLGDENMKKRVVIINGGGGSGKDTFAEFCAKHTNVINISSVDRVKDAAKILVGWDGTKDEKSRKLLVDLKKLSIDYNNYPTTYILEEYKKFLASEANILFIHIREISEIKKLKELLNAETILLVNPRVPKITSNTSDANVNDYTYDYTVENAGTLEDLEQKAIEFINLK